MDSYNTSSRCGFSLVELIIVVTFIMIFAAFSTAYYNSYTEEKKLENAAKRLVSVLDLTRAKTMSADVSYCGGTSPKVGHYSFMTNSTLNQFTVQPYCVIGTPTPIIQNLEQNISFYYPGSQTTYTIDFEPVLGGVSECSYIYIKNYVLNDGMGVCRAIKISKTGLISEKACATCETCDTCP